jgi:hypothetical protein
MNDERRLIHEIADGLNAALHIAEHGKGFGHGGAPGFARESIHLEADGRDGIAVSISQRS